MTHMNRIIPVIGIIVLAIAIAVVLKARERKPAPELLQALPEAPAPDVDTPADTVRSLSAQVAELVAQTKALTQENQRLREVNAAAQDSEKRVAARVRATLNSDLDRALKRDDNAITALSQRLEKLRSQLVQSPQKSATTPPDELPVGFGYDDQGLVGRIHWIDALDAPAVGHDEQTSPFATAGTTKGSLLHPSLTEGTSTADPMRARSVLDDVVPASAPTPNQPTRQPRYTIPANATLIRSTAFSALVGRVPVGGQVHDPMPFKVLIGPENLAANGHQIPGLEGMVMSGVAVGDWTLSCVSGAITSATFIFDDGRVQTFGASSSGQAQPNGRQQESLGWISDRFGVPCISGERITNATGFLTQRIGITALAAAAEAAAASQTTRTVSAEGVGTSTVTGDTGEYVLGKTVSHGAQEIGDWLTERQAQSFDAIFVAAGEPLVVHLDVTLPIDYDPTGRKLFYLNRSTGPGDAYGYLD